jgi:Na+/H+ antiporter NhaD/arsenite permease-like protein
MTPTQIIEVAVALAIIVGAILLYRKRAREDPNHGSQSAVLLLFVGLMILIHGLGLLEYRPSSAELGAGGLVAQ